MKRLRLVLGNQSHAAFKDDEKIGMRTVYRMRFGVTI